MNLHTKVVITPSLPLSVSCSRAFAMVSMIVWRRHDLFRTLKYSAPHIASNFMIIPSFVKNRVKRSNNESKAVLPSLLI